MSFSIILFPANINDGNWTDLKEFWHANILYRHMVKYETKVRMKKSREGVSLLRKKYLNQEKKKTSNDKWKGDLKRVSLDR